MTETPGSSDRADLIAALTDRDPFRRRSALEALHDSSGYVVRTATEIAGRWELAAAAEGLRSLARDRDPMTRHRIFGCDLVERFGDDSDRMELRFLLDDPDGHVRKAVERLLNPRGT